jgi:hypothetical protein
MCIAHPESIIIVPCYGYTFSRGLPLHRTLFHVCQTLKFALPCFSMSQHWRAKLDALEACLWLKFYRITDSKKQ